MNRRKYLCKHLAALPLGLLFATSAGQRDAWAISTQAISKGTPSTRASNAKSSDPVKLPSRMRLGVAAYCFRDRFQFDKQKPHPPSDERDWRSMADFVDWCAYEGVDLAELTTYYLHPDEATIEGAAKLRQHLFKRGVLAAGTAVGNRYETNDARERNAEVASASRWIHWTAAVGAPHVRFFCGTGEALGDTEMESNIVEALITSAKDAAQHGITIGIENHGGLTADQLLRVLERVDQPNVGINLDSGNFFTDTPYDDLARCAPFAVHAQIKASMRKPSGEKVLADLPRVIGILRDAGYRGAVIFEYEDEDDPKVAVPKYIDQLRTLIESTS
jgi:sugar phosphate isomerase/epimerase